MNKRFIPGWKPDPVDSRDFPFALKVERMENLPQSIDLRANCSKIEDQGNIGSCTAQALAGALEYLLIKDKLPYKDLSRLFLYYEERVRINSTHQDSGAFIRDGIKVLNKIGCCRESMWPYRPNAFAQRPYDVCYEDAKSWMISSYERIQDINAMLACLAHGFPFVFGFTVFPNFESNVMARTGVLHEPKPCQKPLGGHAVMAVGYDLTYRYFIVRNSWGSNWGMNGYFTMPFEYIQKYARDFWVVYK